MTHTSRCHQQLAADEDAKRSAAHLAVERGHAAKLGVVPQRRVSEELARRRRGARAWDIVWYLHRRPGADVLSLGSSGLGGGHALPFWSFVWQAWQMRPTKDLSFCFRSLNFILHSACIASVNIEASLGIYVSTQS